MATILLEGIRFHAYHGCFREENIIGNTFEVDLKIEVDTSLVEMSDNVADTVSYAEMYDIAKQEMSATSKTIENVAARILNRIKAEFPQISGANIKVSKLHPAVGGEVRCASVVL